MEYETYEDVIDAYNSGVGVEPGDSLTDYIKKNNIRIKEIEMSPLDDLKKVAKKANGGIMRKFYREGDEVEEFEEDDLDTIELMKDQGIPMGEQVRAQDTGIMQMADVDLDPLEDEYQKYRFDMLEQGLDPMSFEEFRREAMSDMAAIRPEVRIEEVVKEFIRERGRKPNSLEELKEFYEMRMGTAADPNMKIVKELVEDDKTRITLANGKLVGDQYKLDVDGDGSIGADDLAELRKKAQVGGLAAILGV
tara:strand:+ start:645 stop:1394 length:750 start_codon:yes stop_codon:yes gene_type:complete